MNENGPGTERSPPAGPGPGSRATQKMVAGLLVLAGVCVVGTVGYLLSGWAFGDSAFMVVITIFGVGYGEIRPVDTVALRVLTGFVIVAGYGAVIYTVGGFIQLVVDGELNKAFGARRMGKDIDRLDDHTIICGYGRMGMSLAAELDAAGKPYVAIDTAPVDQVRSDSGRLFIHGDATDEHILEQAGIERAAVVATVLSDDATNVFVTLTARAMNPALTIVARCDSRTTESKLRTCGADTVVMPTDIGAKSMSHLIVRPTAESLLAQIADSGEADLAHLGLEFDELELRGSSPWTYRTLAELEVRGAHGYLVVGIRRADGSTVLHPSPDFSLTVGDRVIVLGYEDDIPHLASRATVAPSSVTYRGVKTET